MTAGRPLRSFEGGRHLDLLLIAAITSVLVIRFFLALTGYPRLAAADLHIAHLLWGGFLMLAALVVSISFLGRGARRWAALLGGVGFGAFIDEVGKFVTRDNDYFYRPAVAIIYVVFVLLYLAARSLHRERAATREEYLANALEELREIAVGDLDPRERDRALRHLEQAGEGVPMASGLRRILREADVVPVPAPGVLSRLGGRGIRAYHRLSTARWFGRGLVVFFVGQLVLKLGRLFALAHLIPESRARLLEIPLVTLLPLDASRYGLVQWLQVGSSLLAGVFVGLGVVSVFRARLRALRMFQRSILVSLFLTQIFVFYHVEWAGLAELAFNLLVLVALGFMIEHERRPGSA